jgi:autotransporter-associated beta strand protein
LTLASGTLDLSGNDNYSGGTYIDGGTLIVAADDALLDGSSLIVGADAASIFAPLEAASADFAAATPLSPTPVKGAPEPSTLVLLIVAAFVLAVLRSTLTRPIAASCP